MKDVLKNPPPDIVLKVHWPLEGDLSSEGQRTIVELKFADGNALASMTVPSEQLLQAIAQKLTLYPTITLAGFVSISSGTIVTELPENHAIALDQLVTNAISADMLDDEPDASAMLEEFRTRLLKSLEFVDQAIASLAKD